MSEPDDLIVNRVRQKDPTALVEFVERRRPQLLAYIDRSLSDALRRKLEPQDILQEATLSALNALDDVEFGDSDPFGWMCQMAERRIIDAHRRFFGAQKRAAGREVGLGGPAADSQGGGLIDLLIASVTTPSQAFSRGQREFKLLQALDSLPEESRLVVRLRYAEGLPTKEIAEQIGKSDGAVRVMLSRALSKLREILEQDSQFQSDQLNEPRKQDDRT